MKKQLTILPFFLLSMIFSWSQGIRMNTTIPCNNDLLVKTPGRWLKISQGYHVAMTKQQQQEIENRLTMIHKWVTDIYPEPMAFDATPYFLVYDENFAYQLDIEHSVNKSSPVSIGGTSTVRYRYFVKFCQYICSRDGKQIIRGQGCENGTSVDIDVNSMDDFFSPMSPDGYLIDNMRIDGRPIKMMPALIGKWRGYDFYNQEAGLVLIQAAR